MIRAWFGLLAGVFTIAAGLTAQETPPPAGPLTPAPFPPFQEVTLANGLRLLVVENRRLPIVSLSLAFSAGRISDPAGKEGLASMAAGLLTKGAGTRSADQVAEAIERVGGTLDAVGGTDFLMVNASVLSRDAPLAFALVADAVVRPRFAESELDLLRTQTLSALELESSQPAAVAERQLDRALYGEHPYGRRATPRSVRAIGRTDLLAFQRTRLRPQGALLVVAGDITLAAARREAERVFRGWTGTPAALPPAPAPSAPGASRLILVHRPGLVQSNIVVANLTYGPADPRSYAATVANRVLGGGASARLFRVLREEKSWTYGAYSELVRRRVVGNFQASTEVRTEVTDSALTELLAQLRRVTTEPIPAAELESAKGAIVGSYPLSIQTADQVASAVSQAILYGLPRDYVQTYRVRIGGVTAHQVQAAAREAIRPDQAVMVVVGDGSKIHDRLGKIAPVTLIDVEGNPLTTRELNPTAEALELDTAALLPRQDSFAIRVQGNQVGFIRSRLEHREGGLRYVEESRISGMVEQTTTVDFDPGGRVTAVRQKGTAQGQPTVIEVDYKDGRVTGRANTMSQDGPKAVTIDTMVPAGTIDDNAVQALVPALALAPGASWSVGVFSAGANEYKVTSLKVAGTETLTVGGAQVATYRVEWSGTTQPATFWVTVEAPRRIVKIGVAGAPIEILRATTGS